ncbi:MAG: hypothetical protein ABT02_19475 [Comamonadaceae bacterium SCN 68-20]|nr:MAG: hypothetical protein ABT02_19475 [Comamonadaceae bacterium SCN 68-20]OJX29747.1 MAG: hypothetical protein BGO75_13700 [Burkholderiales bacterium 68-20]UJB66743.1 FecR domain-containing protein [Acidovorax sp. YS12]
MSRVHEEAARWFARMHNAEADDPERGRFEAWLASNPEHAREYAAFENFWQRLDNAKSWDAISQGLEQRRQQRRQALKHGLSAVLLAGLGGEAIWWQWRNTAVWTTALRSETGQPRRGALGDGSQLSLGAASAADIVYSRAERRVALQQGEAAFDVVHDGGRPFIVEAGGLRVTVLGTRFAVNRLADRTRVSVDHGRVQVETGPFWRRQRILLHNGEVAELSAPASAQAQLARVPHDAAGAFAFERGFIDLRNADLAEIATTFSRYRQAPVVLAGPAGKDSRVTASVSVADAESFLRLLPQMAPVNVHIEADGTAVIQRR